MQKRINDFHRKTEPFNGVCFEVIWGESNISDFNSQSWLYHKFLEKIFINLEGMTPVSNTNFLKENDDNNLLIPKNIYVDRKNMCTLTTNGFNNLGVINIISSYESNEETDPFQISFIPVAKTKKERLNELDQFITLLLSTDKNFKAKIGLQINTNYLESETGIPDILETMEMLDMCKPLVSIGVAIIPRISIEMSLQDVIKIGEHKNTHAIVTSDEIHYGSMPEKIDWSKLFKKNSALLKLDNPILGKISGTPILPLVLKQIRDIRGAGFTKHINGRGGIMSGKDVFEMYTAGANSISLDTSIILKPFEIGSIRRRAWELFGVDDFYHNHK